VVRCGRIASYYEHRLSMHALVILAVLMCLLPILINLVVSDMKVAGL